MLGDSKCLVAAWLSSARRARSLVLLCLLTTVATSSLAFFATNTRAAGRTFTGQPRVIARQHVLPEEGAYVRARAGVSIFVPPGVMLKPGVVSITSEGHGVYNVHIGARWHGTVAVSLPLKRRGDTIIHSVGGIWLPEGAGLGERTVWVTQLSWFTTWVSKTVDKIKGALCLSFSLSEIRQCIIEKVGNYVDGKLVSWIESKLPQNCVVQLAEAGVTTARGGPVAVILSIMAQAVSGACTGHAGETPSPTPTPTPPSTPTPTPSPTPTPTPTPTPQPQTWSEQETPNHPVNTFTNYHNASGMGPPIAAGQWVQISCKVYDPTIQSVNPDGYWYRIASSPWNDAYYSPANTFMNGDPYGGPYTHNTDFAVPNC